MSASSTARLRRILATVGALAAILPAAAQAGTYAGPELLGNPSVMSAASAETIPQINPQTAFGIDTPSVTPPPVLPASLAPDAIWNLDTTALLPIGMDLGGSVLDHVAAMAPDQDAPYPNGGAAANGDGGDAGMLSAAVAIADPAALSALCLGLGVGLGAVAVAVRDGRPRNPPEEIRQPAMT